MHHISCNLSKLLIYHPLTPPSNNLAARTGSGRHSNNTALDVGQGDVTDVTNGGLKTANHKATVQVRAAGSPLPVLLAVVPTALSGFRTCVGPLARNLRRGLGAPCVSLQRCSMGAKAPCITNSVGHLCQCGALTKEDAFRSGLLSLAFHGFL